MIFGIIAGVIGAIWNGFYLYQFLATTGAAMSDFTAAGMGITVWMLAVIFASIALGNMFRCRNECLHSDKAMRRWKQYVAASIVFLLLILFFPLVFTMVSPLGAAVLLIIAAGIGIKYVSNAYFKVSSVSACFWVVAVVVSIFLFFYSCAHIIRI
jgi:hypothetical protein